MPTNNEIVAALPAADDANHALLRAWGVTRNAFCLSTSEDSRDFVMIDPDGGGTQKVLIQNGRLYAVDLTDTTTAHDGILCLVSYDAVRYKLDDLSLPYSVLDKDLTAPPGSPAIGDTYLIYGTPTGDWVGKIGYITRYCSRGWEFALPPIGFRVLVEDEGANGAFYFRDPDGDWIAGLGSVLVGANSIPASAIINAARTSFIVENQTTNTPPGSPTVGVAYIIGSSPTGVWAGKAAQVAVCEATGEWSYYVPTNGFQAYDKSASAPLRFNGSVWISAGGALLGSAKTVTAGTGSTTNISTGTSPTVYAYSTSVAPTTSQRAIQDTASRAYTAKASGNLLRFYYDVELVSLIVKDLANGSFVSANQPFVIALYRDSESNAIAWRQFGTIPPERLSAGGTHFGDAETWLLSSVLARSFWITASDAASHTYHIRIHPAYSSNTGAGSSDQVFDVASLADRSLEVFEFTP